MMLGMRRIPAVLALALLVPACGGGSSGGSAGPMPDFQLQDVNPNSPSTGTNVSPRDYLNFVSAWYFGHAT